MQIREIMTKTVDYITSNASLKEAAEMMKEHDCGFLPVGDTEENKLSGVVTDRDITVRAVADGMDPNKSEVGSIATDKVLYCFEKDDLQDAADSMSKQKIYRLVVLNNSEDKKLAGIISLGDIVRRNEEKLAGHVAKGITS